MTPMNQVKDLPLQGRQTIPQDCPAKHFERHAFVFSPRSPSWAALVSPWPARLDWPIPDWTGSLVMGQISFAHRSACPESRTPRLPEQKRVAWLVDTGAQICGSHEDELGLLANICR